MCWLYLLIFLSLISISVKSNDVYVSNNGSDSNTGAINDPVRTISRAKNLSPDRILLKCGDIFYQNFKVDGIDVTSYGSGNQPIICGLKILGENPWTQGTVVNGHWQEDSEGNVWRANLALSNSNYSGVTTSGSSTVNSIGQIVNVETDDMNDCRRVRYITELSTNFDFWQGLEDYPDSLSTAAAYDYIYLYYGGNPNDLPLGVAVYGNGIQASNCTISNLKVTHWGRHGINGGSNLTIDNCTIDGIGGSFPITPTNWTLLGNGIEFYMQSPGIENSQVINCSVSRCFDAGMTLQGSNSVQSICGKNVSFRNNRVSNCCQSFEIFLRGISEEDIYYDCVVEENISWSAGINTGFRYYDNRYKHSHILENSFTRNTGIKYVNNVFANGNYYCAGKGSNGRYDSPIWEWNTCYIVRGQDLMGNYNGNADVILVPTDKGSYTSLQAATDAAISNYRGKTGDTTTLFIILDDEDEMNKYSFLHSIKP